TYHQTDNYVIYPLWLDPKKNLELTVLGDAYTRDAVPKGEFPFYFLERTENPNQLRLAHPANLAKASGSTASRKLFRSLPRGFVHHKTQHMYLFDQILGCVYILD